MEERLVAGLEETWAALRSLLGDVQGDDWHRPTPCAEWDVHDLAAHLGSVEGFFQGFPQPEPPSPPSEGIDDWTAAGVHARRDWSPDEVIAEVDRASGAQLSTLRSLDAEGWEESVLGPLGPTTRRGLAEIRLFDLYLHLLDLRTALGAPLDPDDLPDACTLCTERAITLTPWGAVKKAELDDGARVRLDLSGPGGRTADLVVDGGRGALVDPEGDTDAIVTGPAPAYLLVATGRPAMAEEAGGVVAAGENAVRLLEGYRIFS